MRIARSQMGGGAIMYASTTETLPNPLLPAAAFAAWLGQCAGGGETGLVEVDGPWYPVDVVAQRHGIKASTSTRCNQLGAVGFAELSWWGGEYGNSAGTAHMLSVVSVACRCKASTAPPPALALHSHGAQTEAAQSACCSRCVPSRESRAHAAARSIGQGHGSGCSLQPP